MKRLSLPALPLALAAVVLALSVLRIHYGVNFADEAYSVAVPYRYFLGDQPFREDVFLSQSFGLLTAPFVALFCRLTGGTDGLLLYTRYLYLVFVFAVALVVFGALRRHAGTLCAALIALCYVAFLPFGSPSLGYSSLGSGFFTMALFLLLPPPEGRLSPLRFAVSGMLLTLAVVGLSPYAVPAALVVLVVAGGTKGEWHRSVLPLVGGMTLAGLVLFLAYDLRFSEIWEAYRNQHTYHLVRGVPITWSKVGSVAGDTFRNGPLHPLILLWAGLLYVGIQRQIAPRTSSALWLLLVPLAYLIGRPRLGGAGAHGFILLFALLSPFLLRLAKEPGAGRSLLYRVCLPSFVAALVLSMVSNSDFSQGCTGLLPAFLASLVFLAERTKQTMPARLSLAPNALVLAALMVMQFQAFCREPNFRSLTARIESGPFSGVRTSPTKKAFIEALAADVTAMEKKGRKIVFTCYFPAGYLLTAMRPGAPSVWSCGGMGDDTCAEMHRPFVPEIALAVSLAPDTYERLDLWPGACPAREQVTRSRLTSSRERPGYTLHF